MKEKNIYLNSPQLKAEISRCLNCKTKPCMSACPVSCNPQEFISHAKEDEFEKSVNSITRFNPMGQTCGLICPDKFCMKACLRDKIDFAINIPKVQATILHKFRKTDNFNYKYPVKNGKKIAVIGGGPAGIAATATLAKHGYCVTMFEGFDKIGGALNLIPEQRLPFETILQDWGFIYNKDRIELKTSTIIDEPEELLKQGFAGIINATGEPNTTELGVQGEEFALSYMEYLRYPDKYKTCGNVAIVGGGAVAVDCALTAKHNGAKHIEMFIRRRISDMRITKEELTSLLENGIDLSSMSKLNRLEKNADLITIHTSKTQFAETGLEEIANTAIARPNFSLVIKAIGSSAPKKTDSDYIIYAGDCKHGGSTIVEALASGIEAANILDAKISA